MTHLNYLLKMLPTQKVLDTGYTKMMVHIHAYTRSMIGQLGFVLKWWLFWDIDCFSINTAFLATGNDLVMGT